MKHNLLTYSLLLILLACANTGCKDDTFLISPTEKEDGSGIYVSVLVNTGGANVTKAGTTPTPGENGDGLQPGTNEENSVHDLNVFFFHTTDGKGLNTTDDWSVKVISTYFSQLTTNGVSYATEAKEIEGLQIGQSYNVLVLANLGNPLSINTLDRLHDYTVQQPIQENYFLMASSETGNPVEIQANSKNNPTVVSVSVERLAARVDCHWENSYSIGNDKVEITGAMLVNKYAGNTYAFKRVTASTTDFTIDYLGTEEKDEQNRAANYVIDPKTLETQPTDIAYDTYFPTDTWSATDKNWKTLSKTTTSSSQNNDVTYYLLDYTSENIVKAEYNQETCATYCTGIVFKARYTPESFTGGITFYRYNGNFYASLDKIKEVIGNQSISENNLSQFGITKYEGGICYYTYFIKHAEDGDDTTVSPMEYAIVRNNIYQVNVKGINDIGSVTPTDYRLNLECTVADWDQEKEITIDFSNNYNGDISGVNVVKDNNDVFVAYSQDNEVRDAQFTFRMENPVGVGWTAHLTNPDDFEFVGDYHGVGNGDPVTLQILPRRPFEEGVKRSTRMYITMDTDNEPVAFNQGTETFPGNTQYIDIRQVSTTEYDALTNQDNNT